MFRSDQFSISAIAQKTRSIASIACALVAALAIGTTATAQAGAPSQSSPAKVAHMAKHKHKHKHHKAKRRHKRSRKPSPVMQPTAVAQPVPVQPTPVVQPTAVQPSADAEPQKPQLAITVVLGVPSDGIFRRDFSGCSNPFLQGGWWYSACQYVTEDMNSESYNDTDWEYWNGSQWISYTTYRCNATNYCWYQATPAFQ